MKKEDYLKELNNPESWFKQAFVQKMVADQLKDIIVEDAKKNCHKSRMV